MPLFIDPENMDPTLIPFGEDNNFKLQRHPNTGFWSITMISGRVPGRLSGQFTSRQHAEREIHKYIAEKEKENEPK